MNVCGRTVKTWTHKSVVVVHDGRFSDIVEVSRKWKAGQGGVTESARRPIPEYDLNGDT